MKILLIHNYYQHAGGERVAVQAQADLLTGRDIPLVRYARHNAQIDDYSAGEMVRQVPRTVYSRRTVQAVRDLVTREKPDIAHVHNVFPLISPSVYHALHDAGVPIVQTLHNFRFMCPNGLFYTQGEVCERCRQGNTLHAVRFRCYRDSYAASALYAASIGLARRRGSFGLIDRFIALNPFTASKIVESGITGEERVRVLGNFLPDPLPAPGAFDAPRGYVLFLGRLSPEKGVGTLLRAMKHLPDLPLKVAGDGPQEAELHRLAARLNLPQVEFVGRVVGERKWGLLRRAAALVVPSVWYENMPYTVLEGMAAGTPIIASQLGGLRHLVEDEVNGLMFAPADADDLARKLRRVRDEPQHMLALGGNARRTLEERYSEDAHFRNLMHIYHELLDARS